MASRLNPSYAVTYRVLNEVHVWLLSIWQSYGMCPLYVLQNEPVSNVTNKKGYK